MARDCDRTASVAQKNPAALGTRVAQAQMRSANMGLLLRQLRAQGGRSRAQLAAETGLSKATISSLISGLTSRGLVAEGPAIRAGAIGRPGQLVTIDGSRVAAIGLEVSDSLTAITAVNLVGTVLSESVTQISVAELGPEQAVDHLSATLAATIETLTSQSMLVVGATITPFGVIDQLTGTVRFSPLLGWRELPLAGLVTDRLGERAPRIQVENDATAAAVAEYRLHAEVADLLFLTGEVGIGLGIISDGRLIRGWSGFSGEVGHLPLNPAMTECPCGRRGCLETIVGLNAFLAAVGAADDPELASSLSVDARLRTLQARAECGDERTLAALAELCTPLGQALSILVDVLNPQLIVLGGYLGYFGPHLLGPLNELLESRLMADGCRVQLTTSQLGLMAAARGGALLSLETVFTDPTIVEPQH